MTVRKTIILLILVSAIIGVDQGLKNWVSTHLVVNASVPVAAGLQLTNVANRGLWGQALSSLPEGQIEWWIRYIPTTLLSLFLLSFLVFRAGTAEMLEWTGFAMVVAGGASNLADHWRSYFVTDAMRIHLFASGSQAFNLADASITVGALLLVFTLLADSLRLPRPANS